MKTGLNQRERTLLVALSAASHFIANHNFIDAGAALKLAERGYKEIARERLIWATKMSIEAGTLQQ